MISAGTCWCRLRIAREVSNGSAMVVAARRPLEVGRTYLVKHTARQTKIRALRFAIG